MHIEFNLKIFTWSSIFPTSAKRSLVEKRHVVLFNMTPKIVNKNIFTHTLIDVGN